MVLNVYFLEDFIMKKYAILNRAFSILVFIYLILMFVTILGFNIVTANNISILHIAFGVSSENATLLFGIYFLEQWLWLLPLELYKNKVFSAVSIAVYLADIVCMFCCYSNGAFEKFQHLFESSGVIWQIPLIFDVLLIALLAYRVFALPAHIPLVKKKDCFGFLFGETLRNDESFDELRNKQK